MIVDRLRLGNHSLMTPRHEIQKSLLSAVYECLRIRVVHNINRAVRGGQPMAELRKMKLKVFDVFREWAWRVALSICLAMALGFQPAHAEQPPCVLVQPNTPLYVSATDGAPSGALVNRENIRVFAKVGNRYGIIPDKDNPTGQMIFVDVDQVVPVDCRSGQVFDPPDTQGVLGTINWLNNLTRSEPSWLTSLQMKADGCLPSNVSHILGVSYGFALASLLLLRKKRDLRTSDKLEILAVIGIEVFFSSGLVSWYFINFFAVLYALLGTITLYSVYRPRKWNAKEWVKKPDGWHPIIHKDKYTGIWRLSRMDAATSHFAMRQTHAREFKNLWKIPAAWCTANIICTYGPPLVLWMSPLLTNDKWLINATTPEMLFRFLLTFGGLGISGLAGIFGIVIKYIAWPFLLLACYGAGRRYARMLWLRNNYPWPLIADFMDAAPDPTTQQTQGGGGGRRGPLGGEPSLETLRLAPPGRRKGPLGG